MLLYVYSRITFQVFRLPKEIRREFSVLLGKHRFALKEDIRLLLEGRGDNWHICPSEAYGTAECGEGTTLVQGRPLRLRTAGNEELLAVMAEDAGQVFSYSYLDISGTSEVRIGSGSDCQVCCGRDRIISALHARIYRDGERWMTQVTGDNGLYMNGQMLRGTRKLNYGDCLNLITFHILFLGSFLAVSRPLSGAGEMLHTELPRGVLPVTEAEMPVCTPEVRIHGKDALKGRSAEIPLSSDSMRLEPPPPVVKRRQSSAVLQAGPSLTMAIPALITACLMAGKSPDRTAYAALAAASVGTALLSALWVFAGRLEEKRHLREDKKEREDQYLLYLQKKEKEMTENCRHELRVLSELYPSAKACMNRSAWSAFLWRRSLGDPDFLKCRLGTGRIPVQKAFILQEETMQLMTDPLWHMAKELCGRFQSIENAPWTIDLRPYRLLGLCGGSRIEEPCHLAKLICFQLSVSCRWPELKLVFFCDPESGPGRWDFARWFPHVRSKDGRRRYIAVNTADAAVLASELNTRFLQEEDLGKEQHEEASGYYVVFVEKEALPKDSLLYGNLICSKKYADVTTIVINEDFSALPAACDAVLEWQMGGHFSFLGSSGPVRFPQARADLLEDEALERFARDISGIDRASGILSGALPQSLTFLAAHGVRHVSELRAAERWDRNRAADHLYACIGVRQDGTAQILDLHEKYHGPHGLVAGMTGSEKSDLLTTMLLSFALNYSPDELVFFLIDYKGGGTTGLLEGLPHVAGEITNLSGPQIKRAMLSLGSECTRRQKILKENRCSHLDQYASVRTGSMEALPHILIVVDEFAELKQKEPDFMEGLISISRIGRSLGIHLILATQKPGGTVDDSIRSNIRFALCLRVQDRYDSLEILGRPDAAYLREPGRCCLQVGNGELFETVQTAFSGAPCVPGPGAESSVCLLSLSGEVVMSDADEAPLSEAEETEAQVVKKYLARTAAELKTAPARQLWLPPLPALLDLNSVKNTEEYRRYLKKTDSRNTDRICALTGLVDLPSRQCREPLVLQFPDSGNLLLAGNAASGKSTFLQTMVFSVVTGCGQKKVRICLFDFGNGQLKVFQDLPQVILYADRSGEIPGQSFCEAAAFLEELAEERETILSGGSFESYNMDGGREPLPLVLVVIDRFAGMLETGMAEELVMKLLREGENLGILTAVSCGPPGPEGMPYRYLDYFRTVLCLELSDAYVYAEMLRSPKPDLLPGGNIRGRGLCMYGKETAVFQTALAVPAVSEYERTLKLRALLKERS